MLVYNMANFIYKKAKESMLNGDINVNGASLKIILANKSLYTANSSVDQFVSDIPANAIVKISNSITNVTTALGILDADDLLIPEHDGTEFDAIIMFQQGASDESSRLIFYIDNSAGLPFDSNTGSIPITIIWNDDSNKILTL
jgi:hypothetical protein